MTESGWIFIVGIAVAMISYFAKNFVFQPLLEYKQVAGMIQNKLKYHSNKIFNTGFAKEVEKEVSHDLRQLSCDLEEKYYAIALRKRIPTFLGLPSEQVISDTASYLIFISNSIGELDSNTEKHEYYDKIRQNLGII